MDERGAVAWSEGRLVALADARVPLTAPAVTAGESLFETFLLRPGGYFRLDAHLDRMREGMKRLGWEAPRLGSDFYAGCAAVAGHFSSAGETFRVRATLCRLAGGRCSLWVSAVPHQARWPAEGIRARVTPLRIDPSAPWAGVKSANRLVYEGAARAAAAHGAHEGLLVNLEGHVCEGSITNLFWTRDGRLGTPARRCGILPGVTRAAVLQIASEAGLPAEEAACGPEVLHSAEEVFVTNAVAGIVPVIELDGRTVGDGRPGPCTARLQQHLRQWVEQSSALPGS